MLLFICFPKGWSDVVIFGVSCLKFIWGNASQNVLLFLLVLLLSVRDECYIYLHKWTFDIYALFVYVHVSFCHVSLQPWLHRQWNMYKVFRWSRSLYYPQFQSKQEMVRTLQITCRRGRIEHPRILDCLGVMIGIWASLVLNFATSSILCFISSLFIGKLCHFVTFCNLNKGVDKVTIHPCKEVNRNELYIPSVVS